MDPIDFLTQAEKLREQLGEVSWRSSVSRAYYAVFNYLSIKLSNMDLAIPASDQAHNLIYRLLHNCGEKEVVREALTLRDFRTARNNADYLLNNVHFGKMHANTWCEHSREIIGLVEKKLEESESRERMLKAMKNYQKKISPEK